MSMETKAKHSPAFLRKRFNRMLERCAKHGDKEGNDAEIQDLRDFCELLFARITTGRKAAMDEMSMLLRDAGV